MNPKTLHKLAENLTNAAQTQEKANFLKLKAPAQLVNTIEYTRSVFSEFLEAEGSFSIKGSAIYRHALAPETKERLIAHEKTITKELDIDTEFICEDLLGAASNTKMPDIIKILLKLPQDSELSNIRPWRGRKNAPENEEIHNIGFRMPIAADGRKALTSGDGKSSAQWMDVVIYNPKHSPETKKKWVASTDAAYISVSQFKTTLNLYPDFEDLASMDIEGWYDLTQANQFIYNREGDNHGAVEKLKLYKDTLHMIPSRKHSISPAMPPASPARSIDSGIAPSPDRPLSVSGWYR